MNRERAEKLRKYAGGTRWGAIECAMTGKDLAELCDFYLAQAPEPEPEPKLRPEDQVGVPVRIEDAELATKLFGGAYLYGKWPVEAWPTGAWSRGRNVSDTHVVYIEGPR